MELIAQRIDASRTLLAVLLVSLVANAFMLGYLAERALSSTPQRPGGLLRVESRTVIDRLPPDHQQRIRAQMNELAPQLRPHWAQMRQLRADINALAAAPEPDPRAIEQKLAEVRRVTNEVQARVQGELFASVLELPPDVRRRLGEAEPGREK